MFSVFASQHFFLSVYRRGAQWDARNKQTRCLVDLRRWSHFHDNSTLGWNSSCPSGHRHKVHTHVWWQPLSSDCASASDDRWMTTLTHRPSCRSMYLNEGRDQKQELTGENTRRMPQFEPQFMFLTASFHPFHNKSIRRRRRRQVEECGLGGHYVQLSCHILISVRVKEHAHSMVAGPAMTRLYCPGQTRF